MSSFGIGYEIHSDHILVKSNDPRIGCKSIAFRTDSHNIISADLQIADPVSTERIGDGECCFTIIQTGNSDQNIRCASAEWIGDRAVNRSRSRQHDFIYESAGNNFTFLCSERQKS